MKKVLTIVWFKIKGQLFSRGFLVTMLLLPLFFVYVVGGIYEPAQVEKGIPIAIVDHDQSLYSSRFIALLQEEPVLQVMVVDEPEALSMVKNNQVEGAYLIRPEFEALLRRSQFPTIEVYQSTSSYGAQAIIEIISSSVVRLYSNAKAANVVLNEYEKSEMLQPSQKNQLWEEVYEASEAYWYPEQLMKLDYQAVYYENESGSDSEIQSIGLTQGPLGILLTFLGLSFSYGLNVILKEKEEGTLKRLFLITSSTGTIIWGNLISMIVLAGVQVALLLVLFQWIFQLVMPLSPLSLMFVLGLYLLLQATIVLFLGASANKADRLRAVYPFGVLAASLVGGCFWSLDLLPQPLQTAAFMTPQGLVLEISKLLQLGEYEKAFLYGAMVILLTAVLLIGAATGLKKQVDHFKAS